MPQSGGGQRVVDGQLGGPERALLARGVGDGQRAGVADDDLAAVGDALVLGRGDQVTVADLDTGGGQDVADLAAEDPDLLRLAVDLEGHAAVERRPAGAAGEQEGEDRGLRGGDGTGRSRHGTDHGTEAERQGRTTC